MKVKYPILTVFLLLSLWGSNPVHGQDLIDRTKFDIPLQMDDVPNFIAKTMALEKQNSSFEPVSMFSASKKSLLPNYKDYLTDVVFLDLDMSKLEKLMTTKPEYIELQIPVADHKAITLELSRVEVLTPDFILRTSDGQRFTYDDIKVVFYRGIIKGNVNSTATITLHENLVKGMITDQDGNYVLAQISKQLGDYTFYNDKNLVAKNPFNCEVNDDLMKIGEDFDNETVIEDRNSMMNCIPVYVECDFAMFQAHGSVGAVQTYVANLFAEVVTLYTNEMIMTSLSEVFVWTSNDPYVNLNGTSEILEAFGQTKQNNYNGRLAHFISSRDLGGGIAWLDVLCSNYFTFNADFDGDGIAEFHHAGPYAISAGFSTDITPVPTFSWNVEVFTHEMGHNLGSPHTQACNWGPNNNSALDNCVAVEGNCAPGPAPTNGGTIMSYCHLSATGINFNNGFGPEPGNLIRNRFNNPTCTLACGAQTGCSITAISAGAQTACNTGNNTYTQVVTVTYASPPATGNLVVHGQTFAIGTSPQTVTLTGLTANGQAVNVTASFSATPSCTFTRNAAFTAPAACNGGGDCSTVNLVCGQAHNGNTNTGVNNFASYNCQTWDESGPEIVHKIVTTTAGDITATLSGLTVDLDLFLLSACGTTNCIAVGDNTFTSNQPAGTYYLVVDGFQGAVGAYTLTVTANCAPAGPTCNTYGSTDTPVAISPSGTPTITSTLNVPVSGTITDVNIRFQGTHTYVSDLTFSLTSPNNTTVVLLANQCTSEDNFNIALDDAAVNAISCPINAGNTQRPANVLSTFNGQNAQGNWVLTVNDNLDQDGGQLSSWSLELCGNFGAGSCTTAPPATGTIPTNTYQISGNMTSAGTVFSPSVVSFKASNSITLSPNFEVKLGAIFNATIETCTSLVGNESSFSTEELDIQNLPLSPDNMDIYPNPFTEETTIVFKIEQQTKTVMKIFNMNGQEVAQLVNSSNLYAGRYVIVFNGHELPEGIYTVLLETQEGIVSKRLVLMK